MLNRILIILSLYGIGCQTKKIDKVIVIENTVSLEVPDEFSLIPKKGIDSYVFQIVNGKGIVFHGDFGVYANNLSEPMAPVFASSMKDSLLKRSNYKLDTLFYHFSDTPDEDMAQRIFSRQYYLYDTVNSIVVKIIQPKVIGDGITGLYIHNLRDGKNFSIYSENLDSASHIRALEMFKTLKYK